MEISWEGVWPALTTKFKADDSLDLSLFEKNLNAQVRAGVKGIVLGGTLGESSVLSSDEKKQLVKHALTSLNGSLPVVLNIAEGSLREALTQIKLAEEWGVDGLMILPAMRYKTDHAETVAWFRSLANSTSLPIMIYNNPVDYKTEVTLDMFDELQDCKNIMAVKESTRDVSNVSRMRARFGQRYKILCGVDTLAMEELMAGADGWVAGLVCAFPGETVALYDLVRSGSYEEARVLNQWFMPLLELDIHPKLVQYIKLAESLTGLGNEIVRAPRLTLTGKERERILKVIQDAMSDRPNLSSQKKISYQ